MRSTLSTRRRVFALLAILIGLNNATQANAETRFSLTAILEEQQTLGGSPVYEFSVRANPFISPGAVVESLVSPNGIVGVEFFPSDSLWVQRENLDLSDAKEAFSGTWTFTERRGDELLAYEFTLPEITPDLFSETPTIVSPTDGDTVGTKFLLDWEYQSGAEPDGLSMSFTSTGGVRVIDRETIDSTSVNILLNLIPGVTESDLTISVGNSYSQPLDIISVSPNANATFAFDFLRIKAFSVPIDVTVRIPEPTTILLLGIAVPLLVTRRCTRIAWQPSPATLAAYCSVRLSFHRPIGWLKPSTS